LRTIVKPGTCWNSEENRSLKILAEIKLKKKAKKKREPKDELEGGKGS
jgi:hypothetical protein